MMGQNKTGKNRIRTGWDRLGQDGIGWDRIGQDGTEWDRI